MIEKWKVTTEPSIEPVTLAEMKLDLRIETACTADDALITSLIKAARQYCEDYEYRAYITQTITKKMNWLPFEIILPKPNLLTVTSITYVDTAGDTQTLSSSLYDVDTFREPGAITRAYNANYPSIRGDINGVTIVYTAGYGATTADVPEKTKSAIKLMCVHLYENRAAVTDTAMTELPLGVKALLNDRMRTV